MNDEHGQRRDSARRCRDAVATLTRPVATVTRPVATCNPTNPDVLDP
jgi:hypothetical protein